MSVATTYSSLSTVPASEAAEVSGKVKWGHLHKKVKEAFIEGIGQLLSDAKAKKAKRFGNRGKGAVFGSDGKPTGRFIAQQKLPTDENALCYEGWVHFGSGKYEGSSECRAVVVGLDSQFVNNATVYVTMDHYTTFRRIVDASALREIVARSEAIHTASLVPVVATTDTE
jgi:hypothetical protein